MTEKEIRALASGVSYARGEQYYRQRRAHILSVSGREVTAIVRGSGGAVYEVSLRLPEDEGGKLFARCECPAFDSYSGICKHIVAALLSMEGNAASQRRRPVTDNAARNLLRGYTARIEAEAAPSGAGRARLELALELSVYTPPMLTFKVGEQRMYVLRDLQAFCTRFAHAEHAAYGKNFSLTHTLASFGEESRPLLDFLLRRYEQSVALSGRYGYRYATDKKYMCLVPPVADELFSLLENKSLLLRDEKRRERVVPILHSPYVPRLRLTKQEDGAALESPDDPLLLNGDSLLYVLSDDALHICEAAFTDACGPLLTALKGKKRLFFAEADMGALFSAVLSRVEPFVQLAQEGDFEAYRPLPLLSKIYLDAPESGVVTARAEFSYGEEGQTPKWRNLKAEAEVKNLLLVYIGPPQGGLYSLPDDDPGALYRLLSEGVGAFSQIAEVYASEAFGRLRIRPGVTASVGVRLDAGLLNVDFNLDGLDLDELPGVLASYRAAKKYHRLRDGSFLSLEDNALSSLTALADGLDIGQKDLSRGMAQFSAGHAMAVDALLRRGDDLRVERNAAFRQVLRDMREVENADYAVPEAFRAILRNYQKIGYRWLRTLAAYGFGGILADDMGLGKTIQLLALLDSYREQGGGLPSIVVCPASLMLNWLSEARSFSPRLRAMVVEGSAAARAALLESAHAYDLLITSYDLLRRDTELYENISFEYAVADEAQYIKNQATKGAKAIKALRARVRVALTGTPVENSLAELWSIFDFLMPGYLNNYSQFRKRYELPIARDGDAAASERLKRLVRPFLLRRLKKDVLRELPPKTETVFRASLTGEQRKIYAAQLLTARDELDHPALPAGRDRIAILAMLTKLRQICCDPALLFSDYRGGSAKLDLCMELIARCVSSGHRALLFSQFTSMLDIIQARLDAEGIAHLRIDGSTKPSQRLSLVNAFNAGDTPLFLISLKAGGTGLNLTGADVVIHYDPWWNLSAQNQATDRAHRIGQKSSVQVYKLIAEDTIEERILALQSRKAGLADAVVEESGEDPIAGLKREELLSLLEDGADG